MNTGVLLLLFVGFVVGQPGLGCTSCANAGKLVYGQVCSTYWDNASPYGPCGPGCGGATQTTARFAFTPYDLIRSGSYSTRYTGTGTYAYAPGPNAGSDYYPGYAAAPCGELVVLQTGAKRNETNDTEKRFYLSEAYVAPVVQQVYIAPVLVVATPPPTPVPTPAPAARLSILETNFYNAPIFYSWSRDSCITVYGNVAEMNTQWLSDYLSKVRGPLEGGLWECPSISGLKLTTSGAPPTFQVGLYYPYKRGTPNSGGADSRGYFYTGKPPYNYGLNGLAAVVVYLGFPGSNTPYTITGTQGCAPEVNYPSRVVGLNYGSFYNCLTYSNFGTQG